MSEKRETLIAPLGYMTTPNQYGVFPEGALSQAQNVVMRYKGKLVTAPSLSPLQNAGNGSLTTVFKSFALDAGFIGLFYSNVTTSGAYFTDGTTAGFATMPLDTPSGNDIFPYVRTSPVRSRDRIVVNSNHGVMVSDYTTPQDSNERTLRWAGLPQPNISQWGALFGVSTYPIPNNIMVGYTAILTREYSDGYVIKSVPAVNYKFFNNFGSSALPNFRVEFLTGTCVVGDIVEVYRTDGLSTTSPDADPGTTFKLIARVTLTSTDIGFGYVPITDRWALAAPFYSTTGKELYTNPYQEGQTGANRQPDINGAQAVFKGFTFYGNLTERAQATISVPGGIGDVASLGTNAFARANGIGGRTGAGTVTSGSDTITDVSAADIAGVRVGQVTLGSTPFPAITKVLAVGASTIQMSASATASATAWTLYDWIEGNLGGWGFSGAIDGADDIVELFTLLTHPFELTSNQSIPTPLSPNLTQGLTMVIEPSIPVHGSIQIRASGGAFYSPPLPDVADPLLTVSPINTPNLLRWSKDSEPEHVPSVNETRVGSGKILSLVSTKDALWIFCSDGIFRLSGDAGVWRIDVIAPGCVLCSPGCAVSMRDQVYAYTNYGFVAVTDSGVMPISDLVIKDQLPGPPYAEGLTPNGFLINNDDDEEVIICVGYPSNIAYVYNARSSAFTYIQDATGFTDMTSGMFQQNPTDGGSSSVVIISSVGGVPKFGRWGSGNTSWLAPTVQYRELYAKNPMSLKQWIDVTYIFDPSDAGKAFSALFGDLVGGLVDIRRLGSGCYATVGVPRNYALAASIRCGFGGSANYPTVTTFLGISLRVNELSNQALKR
jgi:hypothetical protein